VARISLVRPGVVLNFSGTIEIVAGGGSEWTPADLFKSGEAGGWWDGSDLATMWADVDGTVPVTGEGQAIARIDDKSGNGNEWRQANGADRPVWTGGRVDFSTVATAHMNNALGAPLTGSITNAVGCITNGGAGATEVLLGQRFTRGNEIQVLNNGTTLAGWTAQLLPLSPGAVGNHVALYENNRDIEDSVITDGSEVVTGAQGVIGDPAILRLGSYSDTALFFSGLVSDLVIINRKLTAAEKQSLLSYLSGKL